MLMKKTINTSRADLVGEDLWLKKLRDFVTKWPVGYYFALALIVMAAGWWFNQSFEREDIETLTKGKSSAFYGRDIKNPLSTDIEDEYVLKRGKRFNFSLPQEVDQVSLKFSYQCNGDCMQVWLELGDSSETSPATWLLDHGVFDKLNWFYVRELDWSLYQREMEYESVTDFLRRGEGEILLTEQSLVGSFLRGNHILYLESEDRVGSATAILTSYEPLQERGGWRIVDKQVKLDEEFDRSQLYWTLVTGGNEEVSFNISEVQIGLVP